MKSKPYRIIEALPESEAKKFEQELIEETVRRQIEKLKQKGLKVQVGHIEQFTTERSQDVHRLLKPSDN